MTRAALLVAGLAALLPPGPASANPAASDAAPVGSFARQLAGVRRLADAGQLEQALAAVDALLASAGAADERGGLAERAFGALERPAAWLGIERLGDEDRGEAHYARGLVLARLERQAEASDAFERARVLAGPGRTRLDAIYDLGTLDLQAGEAARARIPEVSGQPPAPPAAQGIPGAPAASGAQEPDPLEVARAAYLAAREHFVERLRADWRDPDTRANVELCLRRLKELDLVQAMRQQADQEQQQQEQQDQEQQQPGGEGQQGDSTGSEDQQEPGQEGEDRPEETDTPPEDTEQPEENEERSEPEDAEPEAQEGEDEAEQGDSADGSEEQLEERLLTEEQIKRLLERLEELDQQGEEVRARLRGSRRIPVEKDW